MSRSTPPLPRRRRRGRALLAAGALIATALGTGGMLQGTASAAAVGCSVDYRTNDWGSGFTADVTITNSGTTAVNGWTLSYAYAGNQTLSGGWNGQWSQSGRNITVRNAAHNAGIAANGGSVSTGAQFTYSGSNAAPTSFAVNGVTCGEDPGGPGEPGEPGEPGNPPGDRVDNPYVGAGVYVNPEWSANAAAEPGGSRIANQPTGVWLDRTAAIHGTGQGAGRTMGLRDHLDAAVVQAASHS
ncbi:cellulose binding domain-containing protein, partial [Streptomyces sp. G-5]